MFFIFEDIVLNQSYEGIVLNESCEDIVLKWVLWYCLGELELMTSFMPFPNLKQSYTPSYTSM